MKKSVYEVEAMFEEIGHIAIAEEETNTLRYKGKSITIDAALKEFRKLQRSINKKDRRRRDYRKRVELND